MASCSPVEKMLMELISIPSINPAFLPEGDCRRGEKRVADYLESLANANGGLESKRQEVFPGRANLLLRLPARNAPKQRILLCPHLDTVGATPMNDEIFRPRNSGGRIYGRGACDTKGSVAAMMTAFLNMARSNNRPRETEIVFVGLVDEENGQSGSRALAQTGLKAGLAIVGEPTELQVVTAHKGDLWLRLETRGKAAHGARPELGRNAVHAMARIVDLIETEYAAKLRRRTHPLLGHPTVNVGAIRGGAQANIVPDFCEILIDRRTIPGETDSMVRREIMDFLRANDCHAKLANTKLASCVPLETDFSQPLVRQFLRHTGQEQPAGVDYFCDASVLAAGGIPSVVFGPGNIAQAHTADEWISKKSLNGAVEALTCFLQSLP